MRGTTDPTTATGIWEGLQELGRLPQWLAAAADADQVAASLAGAIPEVASGELAILGCDCQRPRLKGSAWMLLCTVTVQKAGGAPRAVALEGWPDNTGRPPVAREGPAAFGSEAWHGSIPALGVKFRTAPPTPTLPVLPDLVDPERARSLLETAIRTSTPARAGLHIAECEPRIARFSSENRCTVVYQLRYPPGTADPTWPDLVVAKAYGGSKGATAFAAMRALWDSNLAGSSPVTIAEPIAYLPEQKVLIQGPIREDQTLKELIRASLEPERRQSEDELDQYLAGTAAGLAALHRCGVEHGDPFAYADQEGQIRELIERLSGPLPELAGSVEPLLSWLAGVNAENPPEAPVPSHGTFRPAQVLLHQGRIGFIDFDGFCQAEPARDVALFRAAIKDVGAGFVSSPAAAGNATSEPQAAQAGVYSALEDLAERFLNHYQDVAPVSRRRVMAWETLDLLTYLLHAWTKVSPKRLGGRMTALRRHLLSAGLPPPTTG